jgi:4-carboxymuconolactone decarboxylase
MTATPDHGDQRRRGIAKMEEVYAFSVDPDLVSGDFVRYTVDHLFGDVWCREALGLRDRRLMTIGVLAALGQPQLLEIQFESALRNGELTVEQVREVAVHLVHYVGWPLGTHVNQAAETVIARRRAAEAAATAHEADAGAGGPDGPEPPPA